MDAKSKKVYKIVLTGGPCGGKTTGQSRLCSFFENLGWKVYRCPECATVLMAGGIKFPELSDEAAYTFQCNLLRSMMQLERTYVDLAEKCEKNCLVICDRGTMDASAYMSSDDWERLKTDLKLDQVDLRDGRYDQIIHMVSAAKGAEDFYTTDQHMTRYEDVEHARRLDDLASQAWVGHPYYDVIDNSTDFEKKLRRMIGSVCDRLGLDIGDRLNIHSKKRKFLVSEPPAAEVFPQFQDFDVVHDYLVTPSRKMQARVRKRGQNGSWTYSHTIRRPEINRQVVEVRQQITARDYHNLLAQRDQNHCSIVKMRRCFLWRDQYFQLDIYQDPCTRRCRDLIFLETYTTIKVGTDIPLPDFLKIEKDVTGDPQYSMFNLSLEDNTCVKRSSLMNGFRASSIEISDTSFLGSSPNALRSSPPNTSWGSPSNTWFGSPPRSFPGFSKSADKTQNDRKVSQFDANHNGSEADLMHDQ